MDKNLWMGDIKPWMDESFIKQAFNQYNFFPQNIKLIHDKVIKELKNYCFVNFKTIEEANNCLLSLRFWLLFFFGFLFFLVFFENKIFSF